MQATKRQTLLDADISDALSRQWFDEEDAATPSTTSAGANQRRHDARPDGKTQRRQRSAQDRLRHGAGNDRRRAHGRGLRVVG